MAPVKASAFWRQAALSYLQYLSVCSKAVNKSLKEPLKSQALTRQVIAYNKQVPGSDNKIPVTSIFMK